MTDRLLILLLCMIVIFEDFLLDTTSDDGLDHLREMADNLPDEHPLMNRTGDESFEKFNGIRTAGNSGPVPIILGTAAFVFVVLIIAVLFVYRRHKRGYANKHSKVGWFLQKARCVSTIFSSGHAAMPDKK